MKKIIIVIVIALVTVALVNLPPVKWFIMQEDVLYSNANGSFTFDEINYTNRDYELCMRNFELFKKTNNSDTVLYRITPMNFGKFWYWGDYLTKEKYKLSYRSWEDIKEKRGPVENPSNFQNF